MSRIIGTPGHDDGVVIPGLTGTADDDTIFTLDGNDRLDGGGENDRLVAK